MLNEAIVKKDKILLRFESMEAIDNIIQTEKDKVLQAVNSKNKALVVV